jgi:hypothetical protein
MEMWAEKGLNITANMWLRLRNAISIVKKKFPNLNAKNAESIVGFFARYRRGSKNIRKYYGNFTDKKVTDTNVVKSYCRIVNYTPNDIFLNDWMSLWTLNPFTNDLKNFILQCRFNTLPLNNRLHSYMPDIDPRCTFCRMKDPTTQCRDSFSHCFFDCPTTREILNEILSKFNISGNNNDDILKLYWFGQYTGTDLCKNTVLCYNIVFDVVRFVIFKHRQRRHIPTINSVLNHTKFIISCICRASRKISGHLHNIPLIQFLMLALG